MSAAGRARGLLRRLFIGWAHARIRWTYRQLNRDLAQPVIGPMYLSNQLHHLNDLERRVAQLQAH